MSVPARNTLAIIGAGPIGLEAALSALDHGLDVHLFERGEVGAHPLAWGHVRMFTPWRMNVGLSSAAHLKAAGWTMPDPASLPTGVELAERYLQPLAALPELAARVHTHAQVVHISRRGALKGDGLGDPKRRDFPFRIQVRDQGGRENFIHAFHVIDASGVYGQPSAAGDGGIPARQELYLAPQLSYRIEDVLGLNRERYAGRRVMVIGAGHGAATNVVDLVTLAADAPGTHVVWVVRGAAGERFAPIANDALPARAALAAEARSLLAGGHPAVSVVSGVMVESLEFNSATHRYRVTLRSDDATRHEEVDQVIVNTGFGPDDSLYRELQVDIDPSSRGPATLATALRSAGTGDCATVPTLPVEQLMNLEPDFFILGHKSYGRLGGFLLATGYAQVNGLVHHLAAGSAAAVGVR